MATAPTKRKPPTFNHLPADRAKKLKRNWVETKKIKAQWRAEKRKEGLPPQRLSGFVPSGDESAGEPDDEWQGIADNANDHPAAASNTEDDVAEDSDNSTEEDAAMSDAHSEDPRPPRRQRPNARARGSTSRGRGGRQQQTSDTEQPSLRELNNLAYSRSSLHTYKSRGARGHESHRARGRGSFQQRGRGRGQPDMRLRMNAMLEKIKRDLV